MAEYIERDAVIRDIENDRMTVLFDKTSAIHHIKSQPAADVAEVKHGKWIGAHGSGVCDDWKCSVCRVYTFETNLYRLGHYCENCGAKMDLGGKEND